MDKEEMKKLMETMGAPKELIDSLFGEPMSVAEKTQQLCEDYSNKKLLEMAQEVKQNIEKAKATAKEFNVVLGVIYKELEKRKVKENETGTKE